LTIETVTPLDESFLRLESDAAHMHVGWVLRLDGPPPALAELRAQLAGRLEHVPRFRRRLVRPPLGLGQPAWADDPHFDVAHHVDEHAVPAPGGAAELRTLAGTLLSSRLTRAAPLWRMTLVTGLRDGSWALVGLAHHALVDGIAAIQVAQLLFDIDPDAAPAPAAGWTPPPRPSPAALAVRGAEAAAARAGRLAGAAARAAVAPAAWPGYAARTARALGRPALPSSLNARLSAQRAVGHADLDLAATQALARRAGVKVNDVVLAAAALALAAWGRRRGEAPRALKAMVPVNVRDDDEHSSLGTRISFQFVDLPPGEGTPLDVLRSVHERTQAGKDASAAGVLDAALDLLAGLPGPARDVATRLLARPEAFNLVVSNVPGPPVSLYILGRRLQAMYPAVPLAERHGLSIGVLSYAGTLHAGLYADPGVVGDPGALAADFAEAFERLLATGGEHAAEAPMGERELQPR
jgi:diacylglycerol O-acyltransferase / wax synthase